MALVYAMCVWMVLCVAVESRSLLDCASRNLNGSSEGVDTLIRVKRTIVKGNEVGQGCPLGNVRIGEKCMSCNKLGQIYKKDLQFCNERCIHVSQKCAPKRRYA